MNFGWDSLLSPEGGADAELDWQQRSVQCSCFGAHDVDLRLQQLTRLVAELMCHLGSYGEEQCLLLLLTAVLHGDRKGDR